FVRILALAGFVASPFATAADVSAIKPLSEAAKIMDNCAAIAKKIAAIPLPKGHNVAMAAEHYNQVMQEATKSASKDGKDAKSDAAKAARAKAREAYMKSIPPEHQAFMTSVRAGRDELRKCGEQYE